jgi:hypothetical protein
LFSANEITLKKTTVIEKINYEEDKSESEKAEQRDAE